MGEHTPGPWVQFIDRDAGFVDILAALRPGTIARIKMSNPAWDGDSRLIAAAPDMLEALQAIVHADNAPLVLSDSHSLRLIDIARNAAAKATRAKP